MTVRFQVLYYLGKLLPALLYNTLTLMKFSYGWCNMSLIYWVLYETFLCEMEQESWSFVTEGVCREGWNSVKKVSAKIPSHLLILLKILLKTTQAYID